MLAEALGFLICPHCGAGLAEVADVVGCANGHRFDVARQGYVSLLPGNARADTADTAEMVAAREAFFGAGHFEPLARRVADAAAAALAEGPDGCVAEIGAGTGYYLARVLERLPERLGIALDLSKHAARRAARAHERSLAAVADTWRSLPLADASAALVLDVFAPRNVAEVARALAPGGVFMVVTPAERHLGELIEPLGLLTVDPRKRERLAESLSGWLVADELVGFEWELSLTEADVRALVAMGPSARHVSGRDVHARLERLAFPARVTAAVELRVCRRPSSLDSVGV